MAWRPTARPSEGQDADRLPRAPRFYCQAVCVATLEGRKRCSTHPPIRLTAGSLDCSGPAGRGLSYRQADLLPGGADQSLANPIAEADSSPLGGLADQLGVLGEQADVEHGGMAAGSGSLLDHTSQCIAKGLTSQAKHRSPSC
jgi:hypothetical protein